MSSHLVPRLSTVAGRVVGALCALVLLAGCLLLAGCSAGSGATGHLGAGATPGSPAATSTPSGPVPSGSRPSGPGPSVSVSAVPAGPVSAAPARVPGRVLFGSYLDLPGLTTAQSLAKRRAEIGRDPRIVHLFYAWYDTLPDQVTLPAGSVLMISWRGTFYKEITSGGQDAMIARDAQALVRYRLPVFLRWGWEMDGHWYDWSGASNNRDPSGFVAAWRHIHDIFAAQGATNVAWVWSPNSKANPPEPWNATAHYYPGDAYVDWVGQSGYSYGRETPQYLFGAIVAGYGARKPIMISETGVSNSGGTTQPDWIAALATWIAKHPAVGALVWFDTVASGGSNWRTDSSAATMAAYRRLANLPLFSG